VRRYRLPILEALLLVNALGFVSFASTNALPQPGKEPVGLSGYVLAPDGVPVSGGTVVIGSRRESRVSFSIQGTGRFRVVPDRVGLHELHVIVPGLAPYRVNVTVPPSRTLGLPVIRLSPATYFRVQLVAASGEPISLPAIRRRSLDLGGVPITEYPDLAPTSVPRRNCRSSRAAFTPAVISSPARARPSRAATRSTSDRPCRLSSASAIVSVRARRAPGHALEHPSPESTAPSCPKLRSCR
jgi:hypothetical protein